MPINLGDIVFGLGPDLSRLRTAVRDVLNFGEAVEQAANSTAEGASKVEAQFRRQEAAIVSSMQKMQAFNQTMRQAGAPASDVQRVQAAFKELAQTMSSGALTPLEYQRSMERFSTELSRTQGNFRTFKTAQAEVAQGTRDATKASADFNAQMLRQDATLASARQRFLDLNAALQKAGAPGMLTGQLNAGFNQLQRSMQGGALTVAQYQQAQQRFGATLGDVRRQLAQHKQAQDDADPSRFIKIFQDLAKAVSLTTGPLAGAAYRLTVVGELLGKGALTFALYAAGLIGIAYAFVKISESAVHAEERLLRVRLQLFALSGSMVVARSEMNYILETANKFGVPFQEVADHFARIDLAARGSSIAGAKVRDMFADIIAYAGNLALSQEKVSTILGHVETSLSRGRLQWREVSQVMAKDFPNAALIAAKAMGVTEANFDRMTKRGDVLSEQFWPKFFKAMNESLGIDASKPVDNLIASENKFHNALLEVNNAMNQTLQFSETYKKTLESITGILEWVSKNTDTVARNIGAIAGILLGGLLGPAMLTGIASLYTGIRSLTIAFLTLNVAMLANPAGILIRLIASLAGGILGFELMNKAINTNKENMLGAVTGIDEYIKAQERLITANSATTKTFLEQTTALRDKIQSQISSIIQDMSVKNSGESIFEKVWTALLGGDVSAEGRTEEQLGKLNKLRVELAGVIEEIQRLQAISVKQITLEGANVRKPPESEQQRRMRLAEKELAEFTDHSNRQFLAMEKGPKELADVMEQIEIEKKIEGWRDKMERAGFTADEVKTKIDGLSVIFTRLKDAAKADKEFVSSIQLLRDATQDLGKAITNDLVDAWRNGTSYAEAFKKAALDTLSAVMKKVIELAALNPVLNALFGTDLKTIGATGTGVGGLLGRLLGSGAIGGGYATSVDAGKASGVGSGGYNFLDAAASSQHGGSGTKAFKFVNPMVWAGAPRLHSGLMPDEFPAILQHGEKVTPKRGAGQRADGGEGVNVHVHESSGARVESVSKKRGTSGQPELHVVLAAATQGAMLKDIFSGGTVSQALERRYGLDRTKGMAS